LGLAWSVIHNVVGVVQGTGSRYDAQIAVVGRSLQGRLGAIKYFMVGCGALGCELFKNFAMMGVACTTGKITVTDDDTIEKSNLSRQFLFRNYNVGQSKSKAAMDAIKTMNPAICVDARQVQSVLGPRDAVSASSPGICTLLQWSVRAGSLAAEPHEPSLRRTASRL
jgi:molybdopterin/thiamine biosynthesis adenylyltransferase